MRLLATLFLACSCAFSQSKSALRFEISWGKPMDGHVVLILANRIQPEPRFQVNEELNTQQIFGADVESATHAAIDGASLGYPRESLDRVPPGEYYAQAVLNVYETFHRADGKVVKLPMDQGEGQQWSRKPGNLYSDPVRVKVDPASSSTIRIELTRTIPPIQPPPDTKYVKHVRIQSKLLSEFWGRPMFLGAIVLLPDGFDEHPEARYPVLYYQSHFADSFSAGSGFRTDLPPPNSGAEAPYAYKFYQDWTSGRLPRMLIVMTQDANPYYDDSYAVNSANVGPYGDALTQELYPYIEKQFRGIGQGWARAVYGGSTCGWRALALQVFYPDFFNGAWVFCPDPIDFRAYSLVNLYQDKNAFWADSFWKQVPIPMERRPDGRVLSDMDDAFRFELALGTKGRSAEQFDIWQAVFSPVGDDGYPKQIIDPRSGTIDHAVAEYWREHYDLNAIMQRDWRALGPKLIGKLHFAVGTEDSYYLNLAVKLTEDFLESTKDPGKGPYYAGSFDYGPGGGHGYTGDFAMGMRLANRTLNQRLMPAMMTWMLKTAPPGADVTSWRY